MTIAVGVLFTTLMLAYFYAVDRFVFSDRAMSRIFQYLLMVDDFDTAWWALAICVLAAAWRDPAPFTRLAEIIGRHAGLVVIATVVILAFLSVCVYRGRAFSMDEYAAVFQAKLFASGRVTTQLPPAVVDWLVPRGFNGDFVFASRVTGEAMGVYWPGFALLLAPFEWLGAPWLCNAALAGAALFLIHRITWEISGDRRAAGWAVLFAAASGAFIANAISLYSMQAHLTANLLFVWLLLRPTPYRAFGAGVVGSLALVLHNPFPHAVFAIPWIIALARSQPLRKDLFCLLGGYLPLCILLGIGWVHLRGQVIAGPAGPSAPLGSAASAAGYFASFSLPDRPMFDMRVAAAVKMWLWAVPCLFVFAVLGRLRLGGDPRIRLLAASACLTFVAYLFVIFDQGHGWGYRYFHSAWGVVPILAGCAMSGPARPGGRLAAFAGAAAVLNLLVIVPLQLRHIDGIITRHEAQLPPAHRPGNNVYFIRSARGFYPADLVQFDPLLRDADLRLLSRGTVLDEALVRQNWPSATLVGRSAIADEWNLGPAEQRHELPAAGGATGFVLAYSDPGGKGPGEPNRAAPP